MLVFLKLGGSLITEKDREYQARPATLERLAREIADSLRRDPDLRLVLGHGSGSYGHAAASRHGTRQGVKGTQGWRGFADVWYQAARLNHLVITALQEAGLPAVTLSPFASVTASGGRVSAWELATLNGCLERRLLPVVHGDAVLDQLRGGTVLSTEDLFAHLARQVHPQRILLAGLEEGVWAEFPERHHLVREIKPGDLPALGKTLGQAQGADVTGGMRSKVAGMLALVEAEPSLEVLIFSGEVPGNVERALGGAEVGTRLHR